VTSKQACGRGSTEPVRAQLSGKIPTSATLSSSNQTSTSKPGVPRLNTKIGVVIALGVLGLLTAGCSNDGTSEKVELPPNVETKSATDAGAEGGKTKGSDEGMGQRGGG
jgi:hypothetical protein